MYSCQINAGQRFWGFAERFYRFLPSMSESAVKHITRPGISKIL